MISFLRGSTLPALYVKVAILAIALYFIAGKVVDIAPFPLLSYKTVQNASSIAGTLGLDSSATYDATYKQGYLRTQFADITIPGHALPVLELAILLPLLLLWPAPILARLIFCIVAAIGVYYFNSFRLATLLYADHFLPAYFPLANKYIIPLGYVSTIMIFFFIYLLVFGRFRRE